MARRSKTYTTRKEAMELIANVLRQHVPLVPGLRSPEATLRYVDERVEGGADFLSVDWERSFAVGCSLDISLQRGRLEIEKGDGGADTRAIHHIHARVNVSWSGTGRSTAEASAAIALYQQVTQLACLLEAMLARVDIAEIREKQPEVR